MDSDCTDHANGFCLPEWGTGPSCRCEYGCIRDEECGPGKVCECNTPVGQCIEAQCTADRDCAPGAMCLSYVSNATCGERSSLACQTLYDDCVSNDDCGGNVSCVFANGAHKCQPICAI
jgi:hypothetical protein